MRPMSGLLSPGQVPQGPLAIEDLVRQRRYEAMRRQYETGSAPFPPPQPDLGAPEPYQPRDPNDPWPTHEAEWNSRVDGSKKGNGFLGPLIRMDGRGISSEIANGYEIDGKQIELPLMVPTLTKAEVIELMSLPTDAHGEFIKGGQGISKSIERKAIDHAMKRLKQGLPVFAQPGEERTDLLPEFPRAGQPAPGALPPDNGAMEQLLLNRRSR